MNEEYRKKPLSLSTKSLQDILFEEADLDIRKNILRMIIKEIVWDSDTKMVYVKER